MKLNNDERFYEEKRKNLKYIKGNRFCIIYGGNYKIKSYPNPHTNPLFDANPRAGDARLVIILILCWILGPQQSWTPNNAKIRPKPLLFLLLAQCQ